MNIRVMFWGVLILIMLVIAALPTVTLIGFGMLPAVVAAIIDRTEERSATFCVGGLNFCGVFPYLMELWMGDNSMGQATDLLTNSFVLAVIYAAAGMGWALYLSLPPVIASFIEVMSQRRLQQLRKTQSELIAEWGDDLIMDADLADTGSTGKAPDKPRRTVPA